MKRLKRSRKTRISTKTVESDNKTQIVQAPIEDKGTQVVEVKEDDENKIFTKVEVEAAFPGGEAAWRNYLQKKPGCQCSGRQWRQ